MNEAGIDCDAGQRPGYIPRRNAGMPSQFPASVGWIQGDAEDATFKGPESDGLANGVGDDGVAVASCCGSVPTAWTKGPSCTPV